MIAFSTVLAFVFAYLVTLFELITVEYPRTYSLVVKRWPIHAYAGWYGVLGAILFVIFDRLSAANLVSVSGMQLAPLWVRAIVIGIISKGIMGIKFVTFAQKNGSFPFGLETIANIFAPFLAAEIADLEFNDLRSLVDAKLSQKQLSLEDIREILKSNIPPKAEETAKKSFKVELQEETHPNELCVSYISLFGVRSFNRIFP
ncbi:MAG: hypothetical protein AAFY57_19395 [Cyanobacteria bacterium J06642_2]